MELIIQGKCCKNLYVHHVVPCCYHLLSYREKFHGYSLICSPSVETDGYCGQSVVYSKTTCDGQISEKRE